MRRSSPSPLWPNLASTCAKISRTFPRHSTWGVNGGPGVEIWVAKCWETPRLQWILAIWIQWLKLGTSRKRLLLVFFFPRVLVEIHTCLHDYCMGPMSGCLAKPGLGNRQCAWVKSIQADSSTIWWLDIPKHFDSGLKFDHDLECEGSPQPHHWQDAYPVAQSPCNWCRANILAPLAAFFAGKGLQIWG
jgi:hypothetical protein